MAKKRLKVRVLRTLRYLAHYSSLKPFSYPRFHHGDLFSAQRFVDRTGVLDNSVQRPLPEGCEGALPCAHTCLGMRLHQVAFVHSESPPAPTGAHALYDALELPQHVLAVASDVDGHHGRG